MCVCVYPDVSTACIRCVCVCVCEYWSAVCRCTCVHCGLACVVYQYCVCVDREGGRQCECDFSIGNTEFRLLRHPSLFPPVSLLASCILPSYLLFFFSLLPSIFLFPLPYLSLLSFPFLSPCSSISSYFLLLSLLFSFPAHSLFFFLFTLPTSLFVFPSVAPSLRLRRPTQTSMNNSECVALQVFPLSAPAPPLFSSLPCLSSSAASVLPPFFSVKTADIS